MSGRPSPTREEPDEEEEEQDDDGDIDALIELRDNFKENLSRDHEDTLNRLVSLGFDRAFVCVFRDAVNDLKSSNDQSCLHLPSLPIPKTYISSPFLGGGTSPTIVTKYALRSLMRIGRRADDAGDR
jgi:hypothetical protein